LKTAFPYNEDVPPLGSQLGLDSHISRYISFKLIIPVPRVALRRRGDLAAPVSVAEATVNKYGCAMLGKDQVGFARKVLIMKHVAKAQTVECPSERYLRQGIARWD
jgi:hypothetical protein